MCVRARASERVQMCMQRERGGEGERGRGIAGGRGGGGGGEGEEWGGEGDAALDRLTSVEASKSGAPLSPPLSTACGEFKLVGRAMVVLLTISPSTFSASATLAM